MTGMPRNSIQFPRSRVRGGLANGDDHLRLNQIDLRNEIRFAGVHLLCGGLAIVVFLGGRVGAALEDVGDVDRVPGVAHRLNNLCQQLSGLADEWFALAVLIDARSFADKHQIRMNVADPEDDILPR